ncbi:MAG TPA: HDOD domain-containing protein, partial [Bacteroidetes bacterium]|nr:HDOD domain-containing protein [Bacteroidota bacterium]
MTKELSVSQILDAVNSGAGLKTLSPVMKRLANAVSGDEIDGEILKDTARYDVALSINLLRAANRPGQYGNPVDNIQSAIDRIGATTARNMALSTEFVDMEASTSDKKAENEMRQLLCERSLFIAASAKQLVEKLGKPNNDHFHTLGLLLDIGVHFLLNNFTEQYLPILERWQASGGSLIEHEYDHLGIDHTIVGQHLAHTWNLGPVFEDSIRYHHSASGNGLDKEYADIIYLSSLVGGVFFMTRQSGLFNNILKYGFGKFWNDEDELSNLLQRVALEADKAMFLISTSKSNVTSIDLLRVINTELSRATLSYDEMVSELEAAMRKAETLTQKLEDANKQLRAAANIDPLTKIYNRRYFEE